MIWKFDLLTLVGQQGVVLNKFKFDTEGQRSTSGLERLVFFYHSISKMSSLSNFRDNKIKLDSVN